MTLRLRELEIREEGRKEGRDEDRVRLLKKYGDIVKTADALMVPVEEIEKLAEEHNLKF